MTLPRFRAARLCAALLVAPVAFAPMLATPAQAQWTVFDPSNYAQNVLTAARTLQQIAAAMPADLPWVLQVDGHTVGCHLYHTIAAGDDAMLHCPHAAPAGGGVCVLPNGP